MNYVYMYLLLNEGRRNRIYKNIIQEKALYFTTVIRWLHLINLRIKAQIL